MISTLEAEKKLEDQRQQIAKLKASIKELLPYAEHEHAQQLKYHGETSAKFDKEKIERAQNLIKE